MLLRPRVTVSHPHMVSYNNVSSYFFCYQELKLRSHKLNVRQCITISRKKNKNRTLGRVSPRSLRKSKEKQNANE